MRYANVIGKNAHGVTRDFSRKLQANPRELEILGDGTQTKSYLHVSDCVSATLLAAEKTTGASAFNAGSEDWLNVKKIADIVSQEMNLSNVNYKFTGKAAWVGDVKLMRLSVEKLKSFGWAPRMNSEQAVRFAVKEMLENQ